MFFLFLNAFECSGFAKDDSKSIDLAVKPRQDDIFYALLLWAFRTAGFGRLPQDENRLSPCPTGTFLSLPSVYAALHVDIRYPKCMDCPAGKPLPSLLCSFFNMAHLALSRCNRKDIRAETDAT